MMPEPKLLVVGSINVDFVARVARAPRAGETVSGGVLARQPGGNGANQAVAAARLGGQVGFVGAVGRDDAGDEMIRVLAAAGVATEGVQRVDAATGTALIVVDAAGETSIVVCPGANEAIDLDAVAVGAHDAVLAQLEVDPAVIERAVSRTDGFFALNVSPVRDLPPGLIDRADLLVVNEGEYEELPARARAGLVALTLGARGAVLLRGGVEIARASAPATSVVSTVGAGDAFAAAITLGMVRGLPPDVALAAACAVGAAAVADERSQPDLAPLLHYVSGA